MVLKWPFELQMLEITIYLNQIFFFKGNFWYAYSFFVVWIFKIRSCQLNKGKFWVPMQTYLLKFNLSSLDVGLEPHSLPVAWQFRIVFAMVPKVTSSLYAIKKHFRSLAWGNNQARYILFHSYFEICRLVKSFTYIKKRGLFCPFPFEWQGGKIQTG